MNGGLLMTEKRVSWTVSNCKLRTYQPVIAWHWRHGYGLLKQLEREPAGIPINYFLKQQGVFYIYSIPQKITNNPLGPLIDYT